MKITEATRLKDLLEEYPWLKDEIVKVNEKFEMLNSPLGKIMATKVDEGYFQLPGITSQ